VEVRRQRYHPGAQVKEEKRESSGRGDREIGQRSGSSVRRGRGCQGKRVQKAFGLVKREKDRAQNENSLGC